MDIGKIKRTIRGDELPRPVPMPIPLPDRDRDRVPVAPDRREKVPVTVPDRQGGRQ